MDTDVQKRKGVVSEFHVPVSKKFPRRKYIVKGLHSFFQADLINMRKHSKQNKGFNYLLVVINVYSKFVWVVPIKSKKG